MTLDEILGLVRVGDSFFRASKPDVLYERTGTLIERNGLHWATVKFSHHTNWDIVPEMNIDEDNTATDWVLQKDSRTKEFDPAARPARLRSLITEKTRHGWTLYDQTEKPQET